MWTSVLITMSSCRSWEVISLLLPGVVSIKGFPGSSAGKESACSAGDPGSIPGSGRSPGEGIGYPLHYSWASLVAQMVKNLPAVCETWDRYLDWEDRLEEGMATHSSILAWRIPKDRRAWCGSVQGVAKSWIQLSHWTQHTHSLQITSWVGLGNLSSTLFFFCHTMQHAGSWFSDQDGPMPCALGDGNLNLWTTREVLPSTLESKCCPGTATVVHWLRFHLVMKRVRVQSLFRELRSHMPLTPKPKHETEAIL